MRPALLSVLVFGAAACSAELREPEACVELPPRFFPGVPASTDLPRSYQTTVPVVVPLLGDGAGTLSVRLRDLEVHATSSTATFGGWRVLRVEAAPPAGSGLPPATLLSKEFEVAPIPTTAISLRSEEPVELGPYFRGGTLVLRLEVEGTPPEVNWLASMSACFSFERRVHGRRRAPPRARRARVHPGQAVQGGATWSGA